MSLEDFQNFHPLRQELKPHSFRDHDVLVLFGELFPSGYANGILEEAKKASMKIIYGTVGRRDMEKQHLLRPLTQEECQQMPQPLINCPLEAGFDLYGENNICKQLSSVRMSQWQDQKIDWDEMDEMAQAAEKNFRQRTQQFMEELQKHLQKAPPASHLVFVHLMAGGIPRLKILYPLMNRVFKGLGVRHLPSKDFWQSQLGRLCEKNFEAVTANTFHHLIELSKELIGEKVESQGGRVSYLAYGYHGTEIFTNGKLHWQSYSPYVQGWAKLQLEKIAQKHWQEGVKSTVFNCPEILTRSSSVFSGLEVSLYPLLFALEQRGTPQAKKYLEKAKENLKAGMSFSDIQQVTDHYHQHACIQKHCHQFKKWPQHNDSQQMALMIETSKKLCEMQQDKGQANSAHFNPLLSQLVLKASGQIMLNRAWEMARPVEWIGHDAVAQSIA